MNFWSDIMCWPFSQHLLTKHTLCEVYKNTVFGYYGTSKTNGDQNIVVKHDLGFETCSLTPNLKIVSYPGLFDEIYQILEKIKFWWFLCFLLFLLYLHVFISYVIYAYFSNI